MKLKQKATAMLLALFMTLTALFPAFAADGGQTEIVVNPKFGQSDARSMLDMINTFRTGDEAFYWNETNTGYVTSKGEPLAYSYALEEIAMQRAAEVALSFSHTRPDGTSCFTATAANGATSWGENIAAGSSTASGAFKQWREDDDDYSGQGHRRNMLNPQYSAIGIGHVVLNGTHYWTQEFSFDTDSAPQTTHLDTQRATSVTVSAARLASVGSVTATPDSVTVQAGERVAVPAVSASVQLSEAWPGGSTTVDVTPVWTSDNASVCTVDGQELVGVAVGSATLSATVLGKSLSVSVTVGGGSSGGGDPAPADGVYAILYDDGMLVFQNGNTPESGKNVTKTYPVDLSAIYYTFDGFNIFLKTPWCNEVESVRVVNFADKISPMSTACWFYQCDNLERVENIQNLDTSNVTNMNWMFSMCKSLTALDVSHFDTANVTSMRAMFYHCPFTTLDVSHWDTAKVTDMCCMFQECYSLKTIYASGKFTTASVPETEDDNSHNMFDNCTSLVGGNGTKYSSKHMDKEYARIDTASTPGYFTDKNAPAPVVYAITDAVTNNGNLSVTLTNPAAVTVAVAYFDTNGQFLSANLRDVEASAGSVEVTLSPNAKTARVMLYDNDCRPVCDPFEVKLG